MSGSQGEKRWLAEEQFETVVDLGGRCDWCDDPLEPGQVVARARTGQRIHEDACLTEAQQVTTLAA